MKIVQTNIFLRAAKKLHRNQISVLKEAIDTITQNPNIGELKKSDLTGVRVYKFRLLNQLILLAYYEEKAEKLTLISFVPHENFYDNLKKQLKEYEY